MFDDGIVIEAVEGVGVRAQFGIHDDYHGIEVDVFDVKGVTAEGVKAARDFAFAQIGKRYDYTMVARFVTRRQESRKSSGKWFCSELVFASVCKAGLDLFRATEPWEVSPGLLARSPFLALHRTIRL